MNTSPTPARTVRISNLMKADQPAVVVAKAGVDAAINAFARAESFLAGMPMWLTTSDAPSRYRDELDVMCERVQFAKANRDRTAEAKWRDIDALIAAWRSEAEALLDRAEAQVADWERSLTARATPPVPVADRVTLEAALANARTDARMVLDGATDEEVSDRLAEMARGTDPVLGYLVLGSWPATYMRGRNLKVAPIAWDHERGNVLGSILTDDAIDAHRKLAGVPHARKAVTALRLGHSLMLHNDPDHFGVADA